MVSRARQALLPSKADGGDDLLNDRGRNLGEDGVEVLQHPSSRIAAHVSQPHGAHGGLAVRHT